MAVFMALPMVLIIGNAFKPSHELWAFPPKLFPTDWTIGNFGDMFTVLSDSLVPFLRYLYNTLFITVVGTAGSIIFGSMCAFVLSKRRFPGSRVMLRLVVLSLMFNNSVCSVINYIIISKLDWIDSYWALIFPAIGAPLGMFLMKQFIDQLPDALLEAATIDGAGKGTIFWQIVMPNVRSAWLTMILLNVQSLWSIGATPYIYKEVYKTLPYAMTQIASAGIARAGVGAAVSVIMMTVPIFVFLFTQYRIIETMATSGMKD